MKKLIVILFLFSIPSLSSAETWVDVSLFSKHLGTTTNYNEVNPGIFIQHGDGKGWELLVGGYKNSYNGNSFVLGGTRNIGSWSIFTADIKIAAVTGYDLYTRSKWNYQNNNGSGIITTSKFSVFPMMLPTIGASFRGIRVNIGFVPGQIFGQPNVITFTMGFKL